MQMSKENKIQDLVNEEEEEEEEEEGEEEEEEDDDDKEGEEEEVSIEVLGPSDVLLSISEQNWFKEQEPVDSYCYSGWEDAVSGWGRVAPLSCILLIEKKCHKQKQKETDSPTPLPAEPTPSNAGSSASAAGHSGESRVGPQKVRKPTFSNQQKGAGSQMSASAQRSAAAEWADFSAVQRNVAHLSTGEKTEEEGPLRGSTLQSDCLSFKYIVPAIRPAKLHKHSHRLSETVLPIKSITFLPPIKSPQLRHRKVPEWDPLEEDCLTLSRKSGRNGGARVGVLSKPHLPAYSTSLSSKWQASQLNPRFFSAPSVSVPRRYRVPVSFKAETVHRTDCTMGRGITQAIAQPHLHPSCLFS